MSVPCTSLSLTSWYQLHRTVMEGRGSLWVGRRWDDDPPSSSSLSPPLRGRWGKNKMKVLLVYTREGGSLVPRSSHYKWQKVGQQLGTRLGGRAMSTYNFFHFQQLRQHCPHSSLHTCIQRVPIPYHLAVNGLVDLVLGFECVPVLQSLDLNTTTWGLICSRTLCLS